MRFTRVSTVVQLMVGAALILGIFEAQAQTWPGIKKAALMTRWSVNAAGTSLIDPNSVLPQYPRPQFKRPANTWKNLNGVWQFQKTNNMTDAVPTGTLTGTILVPYPIESAISGVMDKSYTYAWYKKVFQLPAGWDTTKNKIILHFDAVDYQCQVFVNGSIMAQHSGGYDRFDVDITSKLLAAGTGDQTVVVRIYDPTDATPFNPRGKQVENPNGIFYSACSGIWQTVWLEAVPKTYIRSIKITPNIDTKEVKVEVKIIGDVTGLRLFGFAKDKARATWGGDSVAAAATATLTIKVPGTNLWWPERPYLYDLGLYLRKAPAAGTNKYQFVDSVQSYFGMRKIAAVKVGTVMNPYLNGKAQFLFGPLDQGFWPDGIYTPPSYDAMKFDLIRTKDFGFNITRKHVKVENDLWYWACDSLGLMVYQDLPSLGSSETQAAKTSYETSYDSMQTQLYNHPSIVLWTVFNEGWGEYDQAGTIALTNTIMARDPSRLVNCATGWTWYAAGHFKDNHAYPGPSATPMDQNYICGNGEYGGLLVKVAGHEWNAAQSFGYGGNNTPDGAVTQFTAFAQSFFDWKTSRGARIAVYTEITDQEIECNGLLTYDRIEKYNATQFAAIKASIVKPIDINVPDPVVAASGAITDAFYTDLTIGTVSGARISSLKIAQAYAANNAIAVSLTGAGASKIRIINARGQQMFSTQVSSAKAIRVPTGAWAKGLYFVELKSGSLTQRVRCMVK